MDALQLGNLLLTPEFDYNFLVNILSQYQRPRDCITRLIQDNVIVRAKKGLYVLGPSFGRPFSRYVLANMIYGPSYVSGVSALAIHGLIPERTEITTSSTPNRKKQFETPVGSYTYRYLPLPKYCISVTRKTIDERRSFLVATPEKALVEELSFKKGITSREEVEEWLDALRMDKGYLVRMRLGELDAISRAFQDGPLRWLTEIVRSMK